MKEKLEQIDKLLSQMCVSGDNVMTVAVCRTLLKELYEGLNNGKQND